MNHPLKISQPFSPPISKTISLYLQTLSPPISKKTSPFISIIFLFISLLLISPAYSQSLSDFLIQAQSNNPTLKVSSAEYNAALQRIPQMSALPDPELSAGFFLEPMERYMGNQVAEFSLMQMFPWFGTLSAAREEANLMARAANETSREARLMLNLEVKEAYFNLYYLDKQLQILNENLEILRSLERVAVVRFGSGPSSNISPGRDSGAGRTRQQPGQMQQPGGMGSMGGGTGNQQPLTQGRDRDMQGSMGGMAPMETGNEMVDVLRVQMEIRDLEEEILEVQEMRRTAEVRINTLVNRPVATSVEITDTLLPAPIPYAPEAFADTLLAANPMIAMLQADESAYVALERMNRKMGFPMIGLGLQYGIFQPRPHNESHMNGQNMLMPMVSVSLPIWRGKYSSSVREAQFLQELAREEQVVLRNRLTLQYEEAVSALRNAERKITLYLLQNQQAQQIHEILMVDYSTARRTIDEVFRIQQQLLDYRLQLIAAVVEQNMAVAQLDFLTGTE